MRFSKLITAHQEVASLKTEGYRVKAEYYDRGDDFYICTLHHENGHHIKVRATSQCGNIIKNGVIVKTF